MVILETKSDIAVVSEAFAKTLLKQTPFATSLAINRTAQLAVPALRATMGRVFDRPKPYTLNSLFVKFSNKSNLTAYVGHKPGSPAAKFLNAEITGGARPTKELEKLIHGSGGALLAPGGGVKLDRYGNVPRSVIQAIVESTRKRGKDPSGIFIILPGTQSHLPPGIYQRVTYSTKIRRKGGVARAEQRQGTIKLLFNFIANTHYRPVYDILGVVQRVIDSEFGRQFNAAMEYALSTAKTNVKLTA